MANISEVIKKQIGRYPRNLIKIAKKCHFRLPRIIISSPDFSPTIFWLTCPYDNFLIAELESDGLIKRIKEILKKDPDLSRKILAVNKKYINYRKNFYSYSFHLSHKKSLEEKGIDGIRDLSSLKCLHSHWAHYIVTRKNPIGNIVSGYLKNRPLCNKKCL